LPVAEKIGRIGLMNNHTLSTIGVFRADFTSLPLASNFGEVSNKDANRR
jgi:hypothetical protein